jgi:indole-3-acetate monooxygenase
MIGNGANAQFAWLDPGVAAEMTGGATEFSTTAMFAPLGTVADDGNGQYAITGRWPFNSGCVHSEWFVVAVVPDGVKPSAGRSETLLAFIPCGLATIEDTWYSAGLQGTGSHHLSIASARIPHEHTIAAFNQPARQDGALWRLPFRRWSRCCARGFRWALRAERSTNLWRSRK